MADPLAEHLKSVPPEFLAAGNSLRDPRTGQIHRTRVDLAPCPDPPPAGLISAGSATAAVSPSIEQARPLAPSPLRSPRSRAPSLTAWAVSVLDPLRQGCAVAALLLVE